MMKKILVKALVAALSITLLGGCGSTAPANTPGASSSTTPTASAGTGEPSGGNVSGGYEMPLTTEPVTLKVWGPSSPDNDYTSNVTTTEYEKLSGVHIEWDLYSNTTGDEAFNLMVASGDYPDIIAGSHSTDKISMLVEGGIIIPLTHYIDTIGVNYQKALAEQPQYRDMLTAPDGNIYTFMYTDTGVHKDSEYKMWVYADWLEKLNMKAPTTPEEFKQMLIAFKEQDPNQNGQKDELGLVGFYNGRQSDPIRYLMNAFQLYRENYYYITDDGKLEFIANTDGWREGLRYLNDLFESGLLLEETYVQDESQFKALLNKPAGETIIGAFPFWYQGAIIDSKVLNWTDYEALAPLKGPTGLQQSAARKGGNFNLNTAITANCKNPEIAFKWLDWMISDEGNIFGMHGVEGITYDMSDSPSYSGNTPSFKLRKLEKAFNLYLWNSGFFPRYDRADVRYGTTADDSLRNSDNTYVLLTAAKTYEPYYVWHNIPDVVWCSDTDLITKKADYQTLFNDFIAATDTAFVIGTKDIDNDAEWENYKASLESMGLADYLKVLETFYLK